MYYSIDRIESSYAVLEQGDTLLDVPLSELPEGVQEGDMLRSTPEGWVLCKDVTETRRESLAERRRRLLGRKS